MKRVGQVLDQTLPVLLWGAVLLLGALCFFMWRTTLVSNEFDKRIHVGVARSDVERCLGLGDVVADPNERPAVERTTAPNPTPNGPVVLYAPIRQKRWRGLPLTGWVWPVIVLVYYDDDEIVAHVEVTNVL